MFLLEFVRDEVMPCRNMTDQLLQGRLCHTIQCVYIHVSNSKLDHYTGYPEM